VQEIEHKVGAEYDEDQAQQDAGDQDDNLHSFLRSR
jgi:hypothetical protein